MLTLKCDVMICEPGAFEREFGYEGGAFIKEIPGNSLPPSAT